MPCFRISSFGRWLLICYSCCALATELPKLLPEPQHIEWGSGRISAADMVLVMPQDTAPEEHFAGEQLASIIRTLTGRELRTVQQGDNARISIRLQRSGTSDPLPVPDETPGPNSRESYHFTISKNGIIIESPSSAGIYYGVQTLRQLIQTGPEGVSLPEVRIDDWPSLSYRGTMIDMSEGPLATTDEVLRQIDFLSRWKANQFYFYNEDSIELKGFPILNSQARFSQNDIRRIIAYGKERHIDVIPCLELYGHQHDLFRLEQYSDLADFPHGGEFDPSNSKMQTVLDSWIKQYLDLFPSRFVHIGFDETWEIAQAAERSGARSTPAKLFVTQMNRVAGQFQSAGRTVLAWGDIMVRFPEILAQLPPNLIVVPWWYEPDPDPSYKHWLGGLTVPGIKRFVAPGVNGWSEITPDFEKTFRNIETFLAAGIRAGSIGLINTVWTDDQQSLHRMFWPGMAYGSVQTWHALPASADAFFGAYAGAMYPKDASAKLGQAFSDLAKAQALFEHALGRDTMDHLWKSPFTPESLHLFGLHKQELHDVRLLAERAQGVFEDCDASGVDPVTLRSFLFGSRLLDYAAMRGQYAVEISELWSSLSSDPAADQQRWNVFWPQSGLVTEE